MESGQTRFVDDSRRVMEFYHKVRYDSLRILELTPVSMEEHFEQREDRLYYRFVTFDPRTRAVTKWSITDGTIRRTVTVSIVRQQHPVRFKKEVLHSGLFDRN